MTNVLDLPTINQQLAGQSPLSIIQWAVGLQQKIIVTTNFGPFEAVILHMASRVKPDVPVVWIDSGYNTRETYQVAERIINTLQLQVHVFIPEMTAARRDALMDGIPDVDSELHAEFTRQVKLEPFQRALATLQPDIWLTAVRKEQTAFRQTLDIVSHGPGRILKVAPVLNWTERDMKTYLHDHQLPQVEHYFDPTKVLGNRECGLHTMAS